MVKRRYIVHVQCTHVVNTQGFPEHLVVVLDITQKGAHPYIAAFMSMDRLGLPGAGTWWDSPRLWDCCKPSELSWTGMYMYMYY